MGQAPTKIRRRRFVVERVHAYAASLAVGAFALLGATTAVDPSVRAPVWALLGLGGLAFLAERQSVRVTSHTQMSVSVLPILFAAVLYGPTAGMVVGAVALLADFRRPYVRWVVWTSQRAISAGLAGIAAASVVTGGAPFGRTLAAVAIAAATEAISDGCLMSLTAVIRRNNFRETTHSIVRLQSARFRFTRPSLRSWSSRTRISHRGPSRSSSHLPSRLSRSSASIRNRRTSQTTSSLLTGASNGPTFPSRQHSSRPSMRATGTRRAIPRLSRSTRAILPEEWV